MKIAVYSGSFNPLHIGHKAIMEYLTKEKYFDKIYMIVSPQNPLKPQGNETTGKERYLSALKTIKKYPQLQESVIVDDIELTMPSPQYTIKTLDALKAREPQNDFTLIIGADNLSSIHKWRDYKRILSEYGVAVYTRKGFDINKIKQELLSEHQENGTYKIRLFKAPEIDASSTMIRESLENKKDITNLLM